MNKKLNNSLKTNRLTKTKTKQSRSSLTSDNVIPDEQLDNIMGGLYGAGSTLVQPPVFIGDPLIDDNRPVPGAPDQGGGGGKPKEPPPPSSHNGNP